MPKSKLQKQKATSEVKLTKAKDFRFEVDEVQVDSETEKLTKAKHLRFEVDEGQVDSETEELPVLEESESEQGPK